ncbi:hypothetical protein [Pontibacter harenae]|uniref:hypothetical protein n=1 Tax=Pontibacter harenae TaxID=2894083 RepID=UPI001E2BE126|nr:hypothetical protein [Pontibacter harenae]MCC9165499.1 hypothetical protein [Pontibacter harenae]
MKTCTTFRHLSLAIILVTLLSSCKKEKVGVVAMSDSTKAWLHETNGKISFSTFAGDQQELTVKVKEEVKVRPPSFGNGYEEVQTREVLFEANHSNLKILIMAERSFVYFRSTAPYYHDDTYAALFTSSNPIQEYVNEYRVAAELIDNVSLGGKNYDRVVHIRFPYYPDFPDSLRELFYSKQDGLIAYTTVDNRMWYLDE